ncbi:MAG: ComF family protein [Lachnospiraceae bacterium]|nr:ComF family protein [Lachnospiraceae bacterium]
MNLLKILYPERCIICDGVLALSEHNFCGKCLSELKLIKEPVCMRCGRPVKSEEEYCEECREVKHNFVGGRFSFSYEQTASGLYRFKYMNRMRYAVGYGEILGRELKTWIGAVGADALVPVPLHKKRLIKRGYNQAKLLAEEISRHTGIPVYADLVARIKNTVPQKTFDRKHRVNNLKNAFIVRENVVKLDTVIIVDDIFTTGSTIDSLSEALTAAGVKRVFFITVTAAGT